MEATQSDSRGAGERCGCDCAAVYFGLWAIVSGTGASPGDWAEGVARLRAGWRFGRRALSVVNAFRLRDGRCFSETEIALDVVAGDWRGGNRSGRFGFSASVGRGIR